MLPEPLATSIIRIELVKSSLRHCFCLLQAAAVFKTSYELVMFIQNSTCTIKIGLAPPQPVFACPILIVSRKQPYCNMVTTFNKEYCVLCIHHSKVWIYVKIKER